jgi:hypothetical protein
MPVLAFLADLRCAPWAKRESSIVNEETIQSPTVRMSNNAVSVNVTEEPPKPPPDEDEPNPPIKEPPTEEPPVKEPPPKNR